jgi:fatty acid desaturase
VPWYNLPRVHALLREELRAQRAPFIPSYGSFVWSFVSASLQRVRGARG